MLEKIKQAVFEKYKKEDCHGVFVSVFGENGKLIMSNGALYTDKVLDNILDTLYHWLVEKHKDILYIVVDVVKNMEDIVDVSKINEISLKDFGIAVIAGEKYGVVLPDTAWIANMTQALQIIKQKDALEWNAKLVKFQTDRFVVN